LEQKIAPVFPNFLGFYRPQSLTEKAVERAFSSCTIEVRVNFMLQSHLGGENGKRHVFTAILELWPPIAPKRYCESGIFLGRPIEGPQPYPAVKVPSKNLLQIPRAKPPQLTTLLL
jgi:hypothetical protein